MKKWCELSMTDDPENPDGFILHPLIWRSRSKSSFLYTHKFTLMIHWCIELNDERLEKKGTKDLCGVVATKVRALGSASTQPGLLLDPPGLWIIFCLHAWWMYCFI